MVTASVPEGGQPGSGHPKSRRLAAQLRRRDARSPTGMRAPRGTVAISLAARNHRLPDGLSHSLGSDVLVDLRPPRLVFVREPDLLRVERADQPLAFGARLVELGEEDRHVAADDD